MMDISRGLRFYQQFHRFYNRCLTPLMERQQLSLREIQVLLFLANNPAATRPGMWKSCGDWQNPRCPRRWSI